MTAELWHGMRIGVPPADPAPRAWLADLGRVRGPMADTRLAWLAELDRIAGWDLAMVAPLTEPPTAGDWRQHARRAVEAHRAWRGDAGAMRLARDAADASWRLDVVRRAIADDRARGAR